MEFLLNCGITEETLRKIKINNSEQILKDAEWNADRVISSIKYLEEIGLENIDKLLINRFDIALRGEASLRETFEKVDVEKLVDMINSDIKYVYYLDRY